MSNRDKPQPVYGSPVTHLPGGEVTDAGYVGAVWVESPRGGPPEVFFVPDGDPLPRGYTVKLIKTDEPGVYKTRYVKLGEPDIILGWQGPEDGKNWS